MGENYFASRQIVEKINFASSPRNENPNWELSKTSIKLEKSLKIP